MIKVSHEMPIALMQNGMEKKYNDYSYALVHLFDEHPTYYKYFVNALREKRFVILDNSIFELGTAFDAKVFAEKIEKLVKDAGGKSETLMYVIPDVLDSRTGTIRNMNSFLKEYPDLPGRTMAVAQGETMEDLIQCFAQIRKKKGIDRIGISFNCQAYEDFFQKSGAFNPEKADELERLTVWKKGRQVFLEMLHHLGYLDGVEVHLLGCSLPNEFHYYTTEHKEIGKSIKSLDTSNPVVHGLLGIRYSTESGLDQKQSIKLAEMIDMPASKIDIQKMKMIMYNLDAFRLVNKIPKPNPGLVTA